MNCYKIDANGTYYVAARHMIEALETWAKYQRDGNDPEDVEADLEEVKASPVSPDKAASTVLRDEDTGDSVSLAQCVADCGETPFVFSDSNI